MKFFKTFLLYIYSPIATVYNVYKRINNFWTKLLWNKRWVKARFNENYFDSILYIILSKLRVLEVLSNTNVIPSKFNINLFSVSGWFYLLVPLSCACATAARFTWWRFSGEGLHRFFREFFRSSIIICCSWSVPLVAAVSGLPALLLSLSCNK